MIIIFDSMLKAIDNGRSFVLCSVIAASGSTPRGAGAKMVVFEDGETIGTIGGGAVEHEAVRLAMSVHLSGQSFSKGFSLSDDQKADIGMLCGGNVTMYFQFISADDYNARNLAGYAVSLFERNVRAWLVTTIQDGAPWSMGIYADGELFFSGIPEIDIEPYLSNSTVLVDGKYYIEPFIQGGFVYVFGGGHVSQALVPVIAKVGFCPVVYEDRERFADDALFPCANATILGSFSDFGKRISIAEDDYIIILTRGHQADYEVLEQALRTPASYVGMIGSRSKFEHTRKRLLEAGFNNDDIKRIHNPIGLPILAETPDEIAISIAAELIRHRAEGR